MLKAGLLGYPIDHSLSPIIHNRAYRELGLDWQYDLYSCPNLDAFSEVLEAAKSASEPFIGFNITTPYKIAAYQAAVEFSHYAEISGNANILTLKSDEQGGVKLLADNTDGRGLVGSLKHVGARSLKGSSVVLCGTGAVGMSSVVSLLEEEVAQINILSRSVQICNNQVKDIVSKATAPGNVIVRHAQDSAEESEVSPAPTSSDSTKTIITVLDYSRAKEVLASANYLIDATTVGMKHEDTPVVPISALHSGLAVLDVVYGHGETALLKAARQVGAIALDGLDMLIEQAALTIEFWAKEQGLEVMAPRSAMREAAIS